MKLVKLNGRHKAFKENGHKWAFRFSTYDGKVIPKIEQIMHSMHGSQYACRPCAPWKATFGSRNKTTGYRTYWISFVNENDASLVLLQM